MWSIQRQELQEEGWEQGIKPQSVARRAWAQTTGAETLWIKLYAIGQPCRSECMAAWGR